MPPSSHSLSLLCTVLRSLLFKKETRPKWKKKTTNIMKGLEHLLQEEKPKSSGYPSHTRTQRPPKKVLLHTIYNRLTGRSANGVRIVMGGESL